MSFASTLWFRLRATLQRDIVNVEFDDELRDHIARETAANIKRGIAPDEARRSALAAFGGVERFKEELRDARGTRWLEGTTADFRHGVRLLRKNALFSIAVIGTLALGIGATSTIFTIVNGVLLQTPTYPEPERVVSVSQTSRGVDDGQVTHVNYLLWLESQHAFSSIALYGGTSGVLTDVGDPVDIKGAQATASLFTVLKAAPLFGRVFSTSDEVPSAEPVIILSYGLWRSTFGGDSAVIGKRMMLDGGARTVIGVMPDRFATPSSARFWVPLRLAGIPIGMEYNFRMMGRLRTGLTMDAAVRDLQPTVTRRDSTRSPVLRGAHVVVMSTHERRFGAVQKPLSLLLGAVVVLLLIACLNVANLTMARSTVRRREFAVRLALGAGTWRLSRQLFMETSVLALIGGGIGSLIPFALVRVFVKLSPASLASVSDIHVNGVVLLFTAATTVFAALVFGLLPAIAGSRNASAAALKAGDPRSGSSRSQVLIRSTLVVAEIAAALTLLTGAALVTKSFARALAVDSGFNSSRLYAVNVQLPRARYQTGESRVAFYEDAARRVREIPGVSGAALTDLLPFRGSAYSVLTKRYPDDGTTVDVSVGNVSAEFGALMALKLVAGRYIDDRDRRGAERVALITPSYAKEFFPGVNPLGQTLRQPLGDSTAYPVVVGVISDVARSSVEEERRPMVLLAASQGDNHAWNYLVIRSTLDAATLQRELKSIVQSIDPQQPLTEFVSMSDVLHTANAPRRFNALLINAFAALALVLATVGLYGVMANAVVARTRELGIRIALGAQADSVLLLVLRQGLMLTAIGIAIGIALSFALARTLRSLLFEVTVHDPFAFAAAPVTLALVALAASYIPARRATRVDPMIALRQE
jgi:putative ABC transport system permease protein